MTRANDNVATANCGPRTRNDGTAMSADTAPAITAPHTTATGNGMLSDAARMETAPARPPRANCASVS